MRVILRSAACVLCSVFISPATSEAQTFVGSTPVGNFVLPRNEFVPSPVAAPELKAAPLRVLPPVLKPLRRLPASLKGFRFEGEWSEGEWPIYLTNLQAREHGQFKMTSVSAVSVMPEGSLLVVSINDMIIGRAPTAPPDKTGAVSFDIPPGLLRPGFNSIHITAEQKHRVDCSAAATYELWTSLDPAKTGIELGGETAWRGFDSASDLAAVSPRLDGALAIRVLVAGRLTAEMAARQLKAAQIAALTTRTIRPLVEFGTSFEGASVVLAVGTVDELKGSFDMSALGSVNGPRFGFLPNQPNRPPVFVVTGMSPADLDIALARWEEERQSAPVPGTAAGRRAATNVAGLPASGDFERIAFRQLGFASMSFSGHLLRLGVDVSMPTDFMAADYDRMSLNLSGSSGASLTKDARIRVDVNGHNAGAAALSSGAISSLDANQLFLPLRLMRPGSNHIEISAEVPTASDESCAASRTSNERRLEILDRSELVLPRVARIGRAPELAMTAAGAYPFAQGNTQPILFVPNPDPSTMSAAATFTARLAVAAGRPLNFLFTTTAPSSDATEVLMVSPAPTLDPFLMRKAGLDPDRLRQIWQRPAFDADKSGRPVIEPDATARQCDAAPEVTAAPVKPDEDVDPGPGLAARVGIRARSVLQTMLFQPNDVQAGATTDSDVVSARTTLLVGQDFPSELSRHPWTIVTASNAATLKAGVDCLTRPHVWSRLNGRLSSLAADESIVWVPADDRTRYRWTQSFGISNARLVAAGWLSLNPLSYVGFALALVASLAFATLWLVRNVGRRQE